MLMTMKVNAPTSIPLAKSAINILYPQFSKQLIRKGHEGDVSAKKSSRTKKPEVPDHNNINYADCKSISDAFSQHTV